MEKITKGLAWFGGLTLLAFSTVFLYSAAMGVPVILDKVSGWWTGMPAKDAREIVAFTANCSMPKEKADELEK